MSQWVWVSIDPGVTNRPIRFKLTARTDDPKIFRTILKIHWSSPIVNKRNVFGVQPTQTLPVVYCGLSALEVTHLNLVANNLLRICFKGQSLPNSIIFLTEHHFHVFLTLCSPVCSQLKLMKMQRRWLRTRHHWTPNVKWLSTRSFLDHKKYICNCRNSQASECTAKTLTFHRFVLIFTADVRQPWTNPQDCYFEYLIIRFDYLIIG